MVKRLKGAPVAQAIDSASKEKIAALRGRGITPTLAVVRVGEKPNDLAYEKSIVRHADKIGLAVSQHTLDDSASAGEISAVIQFLNQDAGVHGILLFRPLPKSVDEDAVVSAISPEKDVDGVTLASSAGVFLGKPVGYGPCTAEACMAILKYYDIDVTGKKVCVIGRSPVIGRPVAMMLIGENATVTVCHTRTRDLAAETKAADIVVAAAGHIGTVTSDMVRDTQTLIDVGINFDAAGNMVGDIDKAAYDKAAAYTPVPGGVGAVTTAILLRHVVTAAGKQ